MLIRDKVRNCMSIICWHYYVGMRSVLPLSYVTLFDSVVVGKLDEWNGMGMYVECTCTLLCILNPILGIILVQQRLSRTVDLDLSALIWEADLWIRRHNILYFSHQLPPLLDNCTNHYMKAIKKKYHSDTHFIKAKNVQCTGASTQRVPILYMHISLYYMYVHHHIILYSFSYILPLACDCDIMLLLLLVVFIPPGVPRASNVHIML